MIKTGLVSVSFRKLSPKTLIDMVGKAGLHAIEWGGDVHVPHGDAALAKSIGNLTRAAGLEVAAYGSYYKVTCEAKTGLPFEAVLRSAGALGAPVIRVWAGETGSTKTDAAQFDDLVNETNRIGRMAADYGMAIAFEFHDHTYTDTAASTQALLSRRETANILTYWQPPDYSTEPEQSAMLDALAPYLSNIHVFHWENGDIMPLAPAVPRWCRLAAKIEKIPGDRYAMIEFVHKNTVEQFFEDAIALKLIVS